jgi:CRISPR/Cas system-associated protein Cas10 (large subunit of type III CRISPR-Cas system)
MKAKQERRRKEEEKKKKKAPDLGLDGNASFSRHAMPLVNKCPQNKRFRRYAPQVVVEEKDVDGSKDGWTSCVWCGGVVASAYQQVRIYTRLG